MRDPTDHRFAITFIPRPLLAYVRITVVALIAPFTPGCIQFHMSDGCVALENRDMDDLFRRALEYQPDFPEAVFNLGLSLERLERGREDCMAFDRAAGLRPAFYEAHREAALSLRPGAPEAGRLRALLEAPEAGKGTAGTR